MSPSSGKAALRAAERAPSSAPCCPMPLTRLGLVAAWGRFGVRLAAVVAKDVQGASAGGTQRRHHSVLIV